MNVISLYEPAWRRLQQWRGKLPHALLLAGPRGLGKRELADAFVASLLCEQGQAGGMACGSCLACRWFEQGNHPDFRLLQPEARKLQEEGEGGEEKARRGGQQITIEQVRELDDFFSVGTHRQGLRIILVDPAESLNRSAANAILKVLEEPPPDTLFLLLSSEPMRLLPTLRSRCQSLSLSPLEAGLASRVLEEEGIDDPRGWLALAGGAPALARELALRGGDEWLDDLLQVLSGGGRLEVIASAAVLEKRLKSVKGANPLPRLVDWSQKWLVDLGLALAGRPSRFYLARRTTIEALATATSLDKTVRFYQHLVKLRKESEHPLNMRLFLEQLLFRYRALFVE
ncbi:DNA polymerase III subunit delta' [Azovibrio restrictus]|uniref:DNA polymerase III subunit delta' n=1 Tax=Azovibrio restrictus TaxID=146938 RepID=UPI0026E9C70F|nr:DNA polymerase III subunit delta' [Azovibrio restrictus]